MNKKTKQLLSLFNSLDQALNRQEEYFFNERDLLRAEIGMPKRFMSVEEHEENDMLIESLLSEIIKLCKQAPTGVIVEQKELLPPAQPQPVIARRGSLAKNRYVKPVDLSKAVLWKERCLSLPPGEITRIRNYMTSRGISGDDMQLVFQDVRKNQAYEFTYNEVMNNATLKQVGQEPQYYFPIDVGKKVRVERG